MNQEDLDQIKAVISDAMSANNEVLLARLRAMQDHFDARMAGLCGDVNGPLGRMESRLGRIEGRLDRLEIRFTNFELQMAGIVSRSPRLRSAMAN
jgi:hypothetical protein